MRFLKIMLTLMLSLVILAACSNGSTDGLIIPKISEYKISDLSGAEYDVGSVTLSTKAEALEAFKKAYSGLENIDFMENVGMNPSISRAMSDAHSFTSNELAKYGVTDLAGKISYSGTKTSMAMNFDVSGKYTSDTDTTQSYYKDGSHWIRGKFRTTGFMNYKESGKTENVDMGLAASYALALKDGTDSAKFVLNFGLAASMSIDAYGHETYNGKPLFYGTLKVYKNDGTQIFDFQLTEDELGEFMLF